MNRDVEVAHPSSQISSLLVKKKEKVEVLLRSFIHFPLLSFCIYLRISFENQVLHVTGYQRSIFTLTFIQEH